MRRRLLLVLAVLAVAAALAAPLVARASSTVNIASSVQCVYSEGLGQWVYQIDYTITNNTADVLGGEINYRVDSGPSVSRVGSTILDPGGSTSSSFQTLPDNPVGRTVTVEWQTSQGLYAGDPLTLPDCTQQTTTTTQAQPHHAGVTVQAVCDSGAILVVYHIANAGTDPATLSVSYTLNGRTTVLDSDQFFFGPNHNEITERFRLPASTTGTITFKVVAHWSNGDTSTDTGSAELPTCTAPTTTEPPSTTEPPTTTTVAPTTTTTPPAPDCDCDDRVVTVTKAEKIQERIQKDRTGITCYSIRMTDTGFVVSLSGDSAAIDRVLG